MSPELTRLIQVFANANRRLAKPNIAGGKCFKESTKFEMSAEERGIKAGMVEYGNGKHYAVLVEATEGTKVVVDFTARQFDADCDFPWIGTEAEWHAFCDEHIWNRL